MGKDYFSQDILDDALSEKQKERREKRAELKKKKEIEAEKQQAASENRKKRGKFFALVLAGLLIVMALFGRNFIQIYNLRREKAQAQEKLALINQNIEKLQDELSRVTSPEYIEQQARNRLRMIYPGEILYVILNSEAK